MDKLLTIFVALAVVTANAYCACLVAGHPHSSGRTEQHQCCSHQHDQSHENDLPHNDSSDGHTCPHCTGSLACDLLTAKTLVAPPALVPELFVPIRVAADLHLWDLCVHHDHTGLPPPLEPPTLFNQSCLLTV